MNHVSRTFRVCKKERAQQYCGACTGTLFGGDPEAIAGRQRIVSERDVLPDAFSKGGQRPADFPRSPLLSSNKVAAGKRVAINTGTYIDGGEEIEIGDHVLIGPNCVISSREHSFESLEVPMCYQPVKYGKITIGSDVWLGANVFVKRGVRIHAGCVIAAGTVVTKDVPPFSIFAGVPVRVIGSRKIGEERQPC